MITDEKVTGTAMFTVYEMVTPQVAAAYLATTKNNRSLAQPRIKRHLQRITEGNWVLSPHGLVFDQGGHLIDGQTRLTAQIKADATLPYMVTRNADQNVQAALDPSGSARTVGDWLEMLGYHDGKSLGAAAGAWRKLSRAIDSGRYDDNLPLDPFLGQQIIEDRPELQDHLALGKRLNSRLHYPASIAVALRVILGRLNESYADTFFDFFVKGTWMEERDPIYALQESVLKLRSKNKYGRVDHAKAAAYTIQAWNAFCKGESRNKYSWSPSRKAQTTKTAKKTSRAGSFPRPIKPKV